jgi:hypothetical protein
MSNRREYEAGVTDTYGYLREHGHVIPPPDLKAPEGYVHAVIPANPSQPAWTVDVPDEQRVAYQLLPLAKEQSDAR